MSKQNYELMFIVSPELSEEETNALLQRVQGYLEEADAEIFQNESWGLRRLAYPIHRHREGRYYLIRFTMAPDKVSAIERNMLLAEGVLRELVTRYVKPRAAAPVVSEPPAEYQNLEFEEVEEEEIEDFID